MNIVQYVVYTVQAPLDQHYHTEGLAEWNCSSSGMKTSVAELEPGNFGWSRSLFEGPAPGSGSGST